ncbi:DUF448 domain-containing protein [Parasphingopyxis algicola]|uniref:DUF448 domain-containing protein n=1 Tax=Parasphingopyxis algicola TaxID=2026624 RepID=UPI0015A0C48A|nr:DUF448 domain-containing protein [Parasphingopyxis algicola]QLC25180.1 DUF448 domain-containing protein [Parasphingopyxis algicola]
MANNETADGLKPTQRRAHDPERKCILSGEVRPREMLIRLALSPDGKALPDVRAKAAGRGAWISPDKSGFRAALANGKLKGGLARAFKTGDFTLPDDLPDRIAGALARNALDRLGLEARGGTLITGSEKLRDAARAGKVHLLLHAADAAEDGRRKLDQAWRVGMDAEGSDMRGLVIPADRTILGGALGRENVVHIAVVDERAAIRVSGAISRWMEFSGSNGTTGPGERDSREPNGNELEDKGLE